MSQLQELIARLGKATGPDLKLDAAIKVAANTRPDWAVKVKEPLVQDGIFVKVGKSGPSLVVEPYTASIDAALTLVPEGMDYDLSFVDGVHSACLGERGTFDADIDVRGATPAIALCIAALKARAALSATPVGKDSGTLTGSAEAPDTGELPQNKVQS